MTKSDIADFFRSPTHELFAGEQISVLYLLRREVHHCLNKSPKVPISATMSILAGIDLLGKFLAGEDDYRKASNRFEKFIHEYFEISKDDATIIYQLRNALLHSFGLISRKKNSIFKFALTIHTSSEPLVEKLGHDSYRIDTLCLNAKFETAIKNYRANLAQSKEDSSLVKHFEKMYDIYGSLLTGSSSDPII